jgi:hypothetical protein
MVLARDPKLRLEPTLCSAEAPYAGKNHPAATDDPGFPGEPIVVKRERRVMIIGAYFLLRSNTSS